MSDSIIAQVKRLAEAQKTGALFDKVSRLSGGKFIAERLSFDFPALLAHMQAQQAVVDAARELRRLGPSPGGSLCASIAAAEAAIAALDAALNNLKPEHNDEKQ